MTMFSSGMRKKYKKIETRTFGVNSERLYVANLNNPLQNFENVGCF
jgi:hypothetical protein